MIKTDYPFKIGIKTDTNRWKRIEIPATNSHIYSQHLLSTKVPKMYHGERTDSSVNGAGKSVDRCYAQD
jgi:hypothetical protein